MRQNAHWIVGGVAVCLGGMAALGCSEGQSNGYPSRAGTTAAAATATARPVGPFPRGTANPAHSPDPATVGPEIEVIAPTRGAQVTGATVEVRVRCADPDGVSGATIAGSTAFPGASAGEYLAQVALVPGMNVIDVQATDGLGNVSTSYVSCVQGQFAADDQMLSQSIGISLTQTGLDRVADIAEQQTSTLNLYSLIAGANPLVSNFALKVNALGLMHDPFQFQVGGTPSGIELVVDIDNVNLQAEVDVFGGTLTRADITSSRVTVRATATVSQSAFTGAGLVSKRALGLEIDQIDVVMNDFKVRTPSGALNFVLIPFQGILKNLVTGKLKDMIVDVADDQLSQSLACLDTPLTVQIPDPLNIGGTPLEFDLMAQIDEANGFNGAGLAVAGGLRVTPTTPDPAATRNVLVQGTQVQPQVFGPEAFAVTIGTDALNGILHGLYATGNLKLTIDGTNPSPALSVPMSVKMLYPFLPPVRDIAPDPNTPIVIEVGVASAPLVRLGGGQTGTQYGVQVGEAKIRVLIDYMDGGPREELFTLYASIDAGADINIANNELKISNLQFSNLRADITSEPAVDLADQEIEDFIESAMPTLAQQFMGSLPSMPIPGLPLGLQLTNTRIETGPGLVRVHGDL